MNEDDIVLRQDAMEALGKLDNARNTLGPSVRFFTGDQQRLYEPAARKQLRAAEAACILKAIDEARNALTVLASYAHVMGETGDSEP